MADEGYYELHVLDPSGWSLRSRFPMSTDDPLVVMRARAEAEEVTREANVRGVELVHEFLDSKSKEVRRETVYSWGSARAAAASTTASSRRQILRTARAEGRVRPQRGASPRATARPGRLPPKVDPASELDDEPPAQEPARPPRRGRPWWRSGVVLVLGSLVIAVGASTLIWLGLSKQVALSASEAQPVQVGIFTVILVGCLGVLVWVQRRGIAALFSSAPSAPAPPPTEPAAAPEVVIETPAPVGPARPRAVSSADAVVEVQENRLLRFLRECMLHKDMRAALASDGTLRDPYTVFGVHLFLLGAAEVCVTDTSSGVSDRAHLVRVMKALMRAIGSPEDRADSFVARLEQYRKKPEEHTMILLGQLAMDHYLENNRAPEGALSSALTRWSVPSPD